MDRLGRVPSVALCGLLFTASTAASQNLTASPARTAEVTTISTPITVDGFLNEPVWISSPKIGDLIQQQPDAGRSPTEPTDVTLLRDDDNLYIGVYAYDSEPQGVVATQMARDTGMQSDDQIEILLDTFRDQRTAFYFATNAAGAFVDGLVFADGELNREWDAIWHVRTTRTNQGWIAEFAIPFKSLSFPATSSVWGFNVARRISRKLEDDRWSGARFETRFFQVSEAGEITNLQGLTQGIGLDVRPFLAGRWLHFGRTGDDDFSRKPGLDVFYNFTPNLKLTATFNTDFGETEVDARQINLTRFSLLFPEKRSFFLEGAGVFSFASVDPNPPGGIPGAGADLFPFFSRQIGLLGGQEVPLQAGVKLMGTIGRTEVGVLDVRTGELREGATPLADNENFFVGRIKRNLFQQSYVGAIFTNGHPARGRTGQTYGADVRLATSRFLGRSRNLVVTAYGVKSDVKDDMTSDNGPRSGKNWSYGFSAHYPNDKIVAQVALREIQENFNPALGFVQRRNTRLLRIGASYNPRPRFFNIQQAYHDVFYTQFTRLDNNQVESWDLYIALFDWHLRSGDSVHSLVDVNPTYERLFEPFAIAPGVVLAPGDYRFVRYRTNVMSANRRRISGGMTFGWGEYWSGMAEQVTASFSYRLPPQFTISLSTNQTFARLPEGQFIARIFTSNVNYALSPFLSFSNLIQYDNRSRNLGWQSRVRWTLEPGNDLFFAFNQGWVQEEDQNRSLRFRTQDTKLSAKFQYSYRF